MESRAAFPSGPSTPRPEEVLATEAKYVPGVGPRRAVSLARLGLRTVRDLLFFFPRDYQDLSDRRPIAELTEGELQSVAAEVVEVEGRASGFGKSVVGMLVTDGQEFMRAVWFNQPFALHRYRAGQQVLLSGKPRRRGGQMEMAHPRVVLLADDAEELQFLRELQPIYPLTEGIAQHQMRRIIDRAVQDYAHVLEEAFSAEQLDEFRLLPIAAALPAIHAPENHDQLGQARRRFVFQELFLLQLALGVRHWQQTRVLQAVPMPATAKIDARIRRLFPFELTGDQEQCLSEVAADMGLPRPMNRLLQGEVGSGKTVIAVYAMLLAVAHGCQAALMAPTEILARQHAATLAGLLDASRVRYRLLVGGLGKKARDEILSGLSAGLVDLVIGTQAILQDDVCFEKLGLVVIDEQHKFGVEQRAALRNADCSPHYLVMTATPIPRTMTMALFADLETSTVRELPAGRQPVGTYLVDEAGVGDWWDFVRQKMREGRQAYVIAPLVDESESVEAKSVQQAFEELTNGELASFRVGLVHGRMSAEEKQSAMEAFRSGHTQALVSTSVVEVGVDVPNATVMVISSAERFGLAQLHQLRGRIARGQHPGFCGVLLEESSDEARRRLQAFANTTDGFELAELDFAMRGPGDLFGTQQHGLPPLRIADLRRDAAVLQEARDAARRLVADDPGIKQPVHQRLRHLLLARYGRVIPLGDVG